jgi:hypothetical protein
MLLTGNFTSRAVFIADLISNKTRAIKQYLPMAQAAPHRDRRFKPRLVPILAERPIQANGLSAKKRFRPVAALDSHNRRHAKIGGSHEDEDLGVLRRCNAIRFHHVEHSKCTAICDLRE